MRNVICIVMGHKTTEPTAGVELCDRCGDSVAYYHDGTQWTDRERYGLIDPLRRFCWRIRRWTMPRCRMCHKSLLFRKPYSDEFCSDECFSNWIPF